jgi:hypothetical protein
MVNGYERLAIEELYQRKEKQQEKLGLMKAIAVVVRMGRVGSGYGE